MKKQWYARVMACGVGKATPSCIPVSGPGLSKIIMRAGGFTHYIIIAQ